MSSGATAMQAVSPALAEPGAHVADRFVDVASRHVSAEDVAREEGRALVREVVGQLPLTAAVDRWSSGYRHWVRRVVLRLEGLTPESVVGGGFCCAVAGDHAVESELRSWRGVAAAVADAHAGTVSVELDNTGANLADIIDAIVDVGVGPVHVDRDESA